MSAPFFAPANERTFAHLPPVEHALIAGERVAYRVLQGSGVQSPLVAIHGLGSDHRDLIDVATRSGAPCVLVDLPGFGRSEATDRDHPVARAAQTVLALLDRLSLSCPTWLGCSYGGHIALRAALDAPERVHALVLVSPGGLDPAPPPGLGLMFSELALRTRTPAQVAASCEALIGSPCGSTRQFTIRRVLAHVRGEAGYRTIARCARGALNDTTARRLEAVTAPVELICGTRDVLVPPAIASAAARRLPDATLTVLDGVGHLPWLEAPDTVAARVRRLTLTNR